MGARQGIFGGIAGATEKPRDFPQFAIPRSVNGSRVFQYDFNFSTSVNGINTNLINPYIAPFDGKIIAALLVVKGVAVSTPTVNVSGASYRADLKDVGFSSESINTTFNFDVGTANVGVSNNSNVDSDKEILISGLNIVVTAGQRLGLEFISQNGDDVISRCRFAYVKLVIEKN